MIIYNNIKPKTDYVIISILCTSRVQSLPRSRSEAGGRANIRVYLPTARVPIHIYIIVAYDNNVSEESPRHSTEQLAGCIHYLLYRHSTQ